MSNAIRALEAAIALNTLIIRSGQAAQHASDLIRRARDEGRDLTDEELREIQGERQAAMDAWRQTESPAGGTRRNSHG